MLLMEFVKIKPDRALTIGGMRNMETANNTGVLLPLCHLIPEYSQIMAALSIVLVAAGRISSTKTSHERGTMHTSVSRETEFELALKLKSTAGKKATLTSVEDPTTYSYR